MSHWLFLDRLLTALTLEATNSKISYDCSPAFVTRALPFLERNQNIRHHFTQLSLSSTSGKESNGYDHELLTRLARLTSPKKEPVEEGSAYLEDVFSTVQKLILDGAMSLKPHAQTPQGSMQYWKRKLARAQRLRRDDSPNLLSSSKPSSNVLSFSDLPRFCDEIESVAFIKFTDGLTLGRGSSDLSNMTDPGEFKYTRFPECPQGILAGLGLCFSDTAKPSSSSSSRSESKEAPQSYYFSQSIRGRLIQATREAERLMSINSSSESGFNLLSYVTDREVRKVGTRSTNDYDEAFLTKLLDFALPLQRIERPDSTISISGPRRGYLAPDESIVNTALHAVRRNLTREASRRGAEGQASSPRWDLELLLLHTRMLLSTASFSEDHTLIKGSGTPSEFWWNLEEVRKTLESLSDTKKEQEVLTWAFLGTPALSSLDFDASKNGCSSAWVGVCHFSSHFTQLVQPIQIINPNLNSDESNNVLSGKKSSSSLSIFNLTAQVVLARNAALAAVENPEVVPRQAAFEHVMLPVLQWVQAKCCGVRQIAVDNEMGGNARLSQFSQPESTSNNIINTGTTSTVESESDSSSSNLDSEPNSQILYSDWQRVFKLSREATTPRAQGLAFEKTILSAESVTHPYAHIISNEMYKSSLEKVQKEKVSPKNTWCQGGDQGCLSWGHCYPYDEFYAEIKKDVSLKLRRTDRASSYRYRILVLGSCMGESLAALERYFSGSPALEASVQIFTGDIWPELFKDYFSYELLQKKAWFNRTRIQPFRFSSQDSRDVMQFEHSLRLMGSPSTDHRFDLIIDDADHSSAGIEKTFNILFLRLLKPGGRYVIEDAHDLFRREKLIAPASNPGSDAPTSNVTDANFLRARFPYSLTLGYGAEETYRGDGLPRHIMSPFKAFAIQKTIDPWYAWIHSVEQMRYSWMVVKKRRALI